MRQIEDVLLYNVAFVAAADVSKVDGTQLDALFDNNGVAAMNYFRAAGEQDGEAIFIFLARRKVVTVSEDGWPKLPDETKLFFDVFARVAFALVKPSTTREKAEVKTVVAGRRRTSDTIFQKLDGDLKFGEKIGQGALSKGQPTSTAQVSIETPAEAGPGDPFAAFGGKNPEKWTEEEKIAFASKMGMPHHSQARVDSQAPAPAQKFKPRVVQAFSEGERVEGQVFISDPFKADDEDEGA
jgi:hypothetical protein